MIDVDWMQLIACSNQKGDKPAQASHLYTSPLFQRSRGFVQHFYCDFWAVLSAKHGLVMPDQVIEPYNLALAHLSTHEYSTWMTKVRGQLIQRWGLEAQYVVLAGEQYAAALAGFPTVHKPLAGMNIGNRLQWLNQRLGELVRLCSVCKTQRTFDVIVTYDNGRQWYKCESCYSAIEERKIRP
jgi:hypothetical protein